MIACIASSAARRSGPTISVARSPSRSLSTSERRSDVSGSFSSRAGSTSRPPEQLAHHRGDVRPQPRHAAELQRVRDLVERDPAQQLVGLGVERRRRRGEVGRDEQQPRGRVGLEDRELVLAEHALGEHARHRADLDRQQRAARRRRRRRTAGPCPGRACRRPGRAPSAASSGCPGSTAAGRPARRAAASRRRPGRCRRRRARAASSVGPATCSKADDSGAGLRSGDALGDGGGELPVDHAIHGGSRRLKASLGRWDARRAPPASPRSAPPRSGECGARSSGAPSGSSYHGKATSPPASRTISCAGGDVDRAAAPQRDHPVQPRRGDLAQRRGDRPERAQPVGAARRARRPRRGIQRGSADSMPSSSSRPSLPRRSPAVARQPPLVEPRALAAARDPLLLGPEVVDVAEEDVGHRRPVGDGDRDRVVRQPALGVDRAVDRVDDHQRVGIAEVDLARAPR